MTHKHLKITSLIRSNALFFVAAATYACSGVGVADSLWTTNGIKPATATFIADASTAFRDPTLWPYASDSPWNTPIGSNAQYVQSTSPGFPSVGGNINTVSYSQPVYMASNNDPLVNVFDANTGNLYGQFRIPSGAIASDGLDGHMNVINPEKTKVLSLYAAERRADGSFESWTPEQNDLRGDGLTGGRRAYGGSQLAGLIREGELENGIFHVLATTANRLEMNMNPSPFIWPATMADDGWETTYGTIGNVHMGTLVAIPKSVNIDSLGFSPQKTIIAKALQDYGAYIVDADSDSTLFAEPSYAFRTPADWNAGAGVMELLQVVINNSPTSVGGGGTPLARTAPPFLP